MAITIQLTEIPANESVPNRIVTLPEQGGDFGSAFDCNIQLPDRTGKVALKHGCFFAQKGKMMIQVYSGLNLTIQGVTLAPGKSVMIEDGTIIGIADYIMLVSVIININEEDGNNDEEIEIDRNYQAYFSKSSLDEEDFQDTIVMIGENDGMEKGQVMAQDKTPHFASNGVFSDDPFEDDPFKDEEISLNVDVVDAHDNKVFSEKVENVETFFSDDVDVVLMKKSLVNTVDREGNLSLSNGDGGSKQISQLVSLLENQIASNNDQQSKIFQVIDKTLTSFINEFSPAHLEDVFDDFGTPFFVQKEKQYWRSYRKSFNRRLEKGEYHRLFKALLLENMQGNSVMNNDEKKKAGND
ncbi:MAG: hypothetical protein MJK12_04345 [Colwellia sp.]|nr:hypothetical protein [Colwellia sp.]